jgi:hypothetical protein
MSKWKKGLSTNPFFQHMKGQSPPELETSCEFIVWHFLDVTMTHWCTTLNSPSSNSSSHAFVLVSLHAHSLTHLLTRSWILTMQPKMWAGFCSVGHRNGNSYHIMQRWIWRYKPNTNHYIVWCVQATIDMMQVDSSYGDSPVFARTAWMVLY